MSAHASMDLITALWLGFVGACVGSFLNVVAYRLPLGMSVVWRSSHCPNCKHPIRARDNVPVLGWLLLRGKCRDCSEPISPRYAIVEAIMGVTFFALAYSELFAGGSTLLMAPLTERTGAADVVWNPHWPTIALYAWHCLMASILMTLALMRLDKNLSTPKLIALLAIVAIGWLAVPHFLAG